MILHFAPDAVECALLYDTDFTSIDFDSVLGFLNATFMTPGKRFERTTESGGDFALFEGHGMFVLISHNRQPLAGDGFAGALQSAYTSLLVEDADARVSRHAANVFITVSNHPPLPDHPALQAVGYKGFSGEQSVDQFENKLMLCRVLAGFMVQQQMPSLVHWCQSNTLLLPDTLMSEAQGNEATWLYLHPNFFSPGVAGNGQQLLGARLHGSAQLINADVSFAAAPVPPMYVCERLANFVDMVRMRHGEPIPDGDTFGADETEIIRVRHLQHTGAGHPAQIELTVERNEEFGIAGEPAGAKPPSEAVKAAPAIPADSPARNGLNGAATSAAPALTDVPEAGPIAKSHQAIVAAAAAPPADGGPAAASAQPSAAAPAAPAAAPVSHVAPIMEVEDVAPPAPRGSAMAAEAAHLTFADPVLDPNAKTAPADFEWSNTDEAVVQAPAYKTFRFTRENAPKPRMPDMIPTGGLLGKLRPAKPRPAPVVQPAQQQANVVMVETKKVGGLLSRFRREKPVMEPALKPVVLHTEAAPAETPSPSAMRGLLSKLPFRRSGTSS